MIFPELIKVKNANHTIRGKTVVKQQYKIDWSKKDEYHREHEYDWHERHGSLDKKQLKELKHFYDSDADWGEENFPLELQPFLDEYSEVIIDDYYMKEILHFKELALSEWNRQRSFDTAIREGCLSVAQESVNRYFFLIKDCFLVNKEVNNKNMLYKAKSDHRFGYDIIHSMWLFRFWKHQTGSGLVSRKGLSAYRGYTSNYKDEKIEYLKPIYDKNMGFKLLPEENFGFGDDIVNPKKYDRFEALKDFLNGRMRGKTLEKILD